MSKVSIQGFAEKGAMRQEAIQLLGAKIRRDPKRRTPDAECRPRGELEN